MITSFVTVAAQRVSLEMAVAFARSGTPFVVIPCITVEQYQEMVSLLDERLKFVTDSVEDHK